MNSATQIWAEARDMLETLDLIGLPDVEAKDFRQSLEFIMEKAIALGAEVS